MTGDLFESDRQTSTRDALLQAFDGWIAERARSMRAGRRRGALRPSSIDVYQDMWAQFVARCVDHQCALATIDAVDLVAFLDALGGSREATPRSSAASSAARTDSPRDSWPVRPTRSTACSGS